jgi:thiol-disulfide isomerase/thioredoxin
MLVSLLVVLVLLILVWYVSTPVIVYKFFRPDCPHCVNLQENWSELETYLASKNIRVINVNNNSEYSKDLVAKYEIKGVPTIIAVGKYGSKVEYDGDRSVDDLIKWADSL